MAIIIETLIQAGHNVPAAEGISSGIQARSALQGKGINHSAHT
jgi:hypothetical protein